MPTPKSQSPSIVGFLLPMSNTAFTEISSDMLSDMDAKNAKIKKERKSDNKGYKTIAKLVAE